MPWRKLITYSVWVLLLVCATTGLYFFVEVESRAYQQSAQRGIDWLRSNPNPFTNPGIVWALDDINSRYCKSDSFSQELIQRFRQRERTPIEEAYFSMLSFSHVATSTLPTHIEGSYDQWLLSALLCTEESMHTEVIAEILHVENATGYDLTHKYLALSYLAHSGCQVEKLTLREARDKAAQKIATEAKDAQYVFSDLLVEQGAFLVWGGDGFLVNHAWKESVLNAQRSSGGWAGAEGQDDHPHTTALATWMFSLLSRTCPL